jgi:PhoPQ-activated pathogenicity-related protein
MKSISTKTFFSFFTFLFLNIGVFAQNVVVTPQTALNNYISNNDKSFQWELKDSSAMGNVKIYQLLLTSQKWHNYTWRHQLTVFVPKNRQYSDALLFITGGSNKDEQPNWTKSDGLWPSLAGLAEKNKATVALIRQVPNQPFFGNLTEDALISYTLNQFKKDKDYINSNSKND